MSGHWSDDEISFINRIVDEKFRYYQRYSGEVKKVDSDGVIEVHSKEFGTTESEPNSWIVCRPSVNYHSFIPPKIGDKVEFGFKDGSADSGRYYCFDPLFYKENGNVPGMVSIYEDKDGTKILYNRTTKQFSFVVQGQILINSNGQLELKGVLPTQKTLLGETTKSKLESLIDEMKTLVDNVSAIVANIKLIEVTPVAFGTPAGINNAPSFTTNEGQLVVTKTALDSVKTSLSTILSNEVKNS
ncbi:hypothetical protein [Leptospira phage LE3]|uniref:Uncharacterized protein n=1 Tax=Leptospira phage LE3 TaxID=2041382 RepID=A0A343LE43_9CAUD|nr:hypothetical protein HWB33_gp41 [Leptospira phage LE3]ATN94953.1 hypothetical protein [Leptospira phage LE3]